MIERDVYMEILPKLIKKLKDIGIEEKRIITEYRIGRFCADCVVLSSDGKTPALCFEVKRSFKSFSSEYLKLFDIYNKYVGVEVCYFVYLENEDVVLSNISAKKIKLNSDDFNISRFLGYYANDLAIMEVNRASANSIDKFTNRALCAVISSVAVFLPLDVLGLFPLTYERMLFVVAMITFVILPHLVKVVVVHPELIEVLKKAYKYL